MAPVKQVKLFLLDAFNGKCPCSGTTAQIPPGSVGQRFGTFAERRRILFDPASLRYIHVAYRCGEYRIGA